MHESPSAPTTLQRDLKKLWSWKNSSLWGGLLLHDFSLAWFLFGLPLWKLSCLITLEIWSLVLNLVLLSSKSRLTKPWFHTLVFLGQNYYVIRLKYFGTIEKIGHWYTRFIFHYIFLKHLKSSNISFIVL